MGSSLRETSAQYAHIQEAPTVRGKKRAEEEVRVSQQATPIGIVAHCARFAVGPEHNCSTVPPKSSPRSRSKVSRWARHFERRVCSRVCSGGGFFPLGSRPMVTVKENGGREKPRV